ncbi:hypothetical protein JCM11641_008378 [Rhodosporidiobolus odoratus]
MDNPVSAKEEPPVASFLDRLPPGSPSSSSLDGTLSETFPDLDESQEVPASLFASFPALHTLKLTGVSELGLSHLYILASTSSTLENLLFPYSTWVFHPRRFLPYPSSSEAPPAASSTSLAQPNPPYLVTRMFQAEQDLSRALIRFSALQRVDLGILPVVFGGRGRGEQRSPLSELERACERLGVNFSWMAAVG